MGAWAKYKIISFVPALAHHRIDHLTSGNLRIEQDCVSALKNEIATFFEENYHISLSVLEDPIRIKQCLKPRLEVHENQISLPMETSDDRKKFLPILVSKFQDISIRAGGRTTIDITLKGVDKGLPANYFKNHFGELLAFLDISQFPVSRSSWVVMADADGTLFDPIIPGQDPMTSHLGNIPARDPILTYLREGGIFAVNSGNDLSKIAQKIFLGIPENERHLLNHIALFGNTGTALGKLRPDGTLVRSTHYQEHALDEPDGTSDIKIVYAGDEESPTGNDYPVFQAVGFRNAVCVGAQQPPDSELSKHWIPGGPKGFATFMAEWNQKIMDNPDGDVDSVIARIK